MNNAPEAQSLFQEAHDRDDMTPDERLRNIARGLDLLTRDLDLELRIIRGRTGRMASKLVAR